MGVNTNKHACKSCLYHYNRYLGGRGNALSPPAKANAVTEEEGVCVCVCLGGGGVDLECRVKRRVNWILISLFADGPGSKSHNKSHVRTSPASEEKTHRGVQRVSTEI